MKLPTQCRLWKKKQLTNQDLDLHENFDVMHTFTDASHHARKLLKCKECGQLYFYEYYEKIDWATGNDPQYSTFIPIDTEDKTKLFKDLSPLELMGYPRIQWDWPIKEGEPDARWAPGFADNPKFEQNIKELKEFEKEIEQSYHNNH